jgi:hypothetical protein
MNNSEIYKMQNIEFTEKELKSIFLKYENPVLYKFKKVFELKYSKNLGYYLLENIRLKLSAKELPYTKKGTYNIFNGYYLN